MYLVRPVDFTDLPALERLAKQAGFGFTNFPANRDKLNDKIASSRRSIQMDINLPNDESYYFVLVNTRNDKVVGVCGIESMVGIQSPFYSYRIEDVVHTSPQLQIHNRIPALFLCNDYNGNSRLIALIVDKAHQNPLTMSLLSRARLLFIARHPERFTSKLFVELRGESDDAGFSPFWNALGKHFFSMDFEKADYLSGVSNKHFIADLMPRYPIYIPTLPDVAQQVIGVIHESSEKVSDILLKEGFLFKNYIDVFDAGPTIEARQEEVNTISNSQQSSYLVVPMSAVEAENNELTTGTYLISNGKREEFKVTVAEAGLIGADQILQITSTTKAVLALKEGEDIQWIPV